MLTLAIITIIFLPGAFIATLFSTDMFHFGGGDDNQQMRIYFAVSVPLTAVILVLWLAWFHTTSTTELDGLVDDEEKGSRPRWKAGDGKEKKEKLK